MKLNTKRTVLIGSAFLAICAFWQMYNNVVPLMLTNTFHMNETYSGMIMAADNVLALFLLPFFGSLSDRCTSKLGRRTPFIIVGTLIAVVLMMFLPLLDNAYFANPVTSTLIAFIAVLFCLLVAMGTYRSPAVALMPDLTPKPLRSAGNAVINLMGALGGVAYLAIAAVMYSSSRTEGLAHVNYLPLFAVVAAIMILSVVVVVTTIRERELEQEVAAYEAAHPEENLAEIDESGEEVLPAPVQKSLAALLISIALWFIGYNATETWFTTYATAEWSMSLGSASLCLIIANLGAIAAFIPAGKLAGTIGRKKTILIGIATLGSTLAFFAVWTFFGGGFSPLLYVVMFILGAGWAAINVNSLPMVVEMCKGSDVGKFTGYYYTFSMAAQTISPVAAGWLMNNISYRSLFVYAAAFVFSSALSMQFVHHGDTKTTGTKASVEDFENLEI